MSKKHDHSHDHEHHGHHHHHQVEGNLALAFFLNVSFAIIEIFGGIYTNSVAIISDAIHDLGDSMAIGFAWYLEKKSKKQSDIHFSYGYRRLSILAALLTGVILLLGSILVLAKSIPRILNPEQPEVNGMIGLAFLGLAVNGFAAYRVSSNSSLNSRMISLHLLEDVFGWAIVLVAAIVMKFWQFPQIDAILAVMLASWVIFNVFKGLKSSIQIFLQMIPMGFDVSKISMRMTSIPGVESVHHLHAWTLDGEKHLLTAHLKVSTKAVEEWADIKVKVKKLLQEEFSIFEATLEIEHQTEQCFDPEHNTF
jgi:cobalt-zinc-cadmium efflux system protein